MSWLQSILLALQLIGKLVDWLRERQLIEAGEAKAIAEGLEVSNARVKAALDARRAADARGVRDDDNDPYRRD